MAMVFNNNYKPAEGSFNEYGHELINNRWCATDDDISFNLSYRIVNNIKLTQDYLDKAQDSFYQICVDLKRFKEEKRYKFFNYRSFERCCIDRFGLGIRQVQKYISIATNISYEHFQKIKNTNSSSPFSVNKYYILSRLTSDEREELTNNIDISSISVKELEQKSKEIKQNREVSKPVEPIPDVNKGSTDLEHTPVKELEENAKEIKNEHMIKFIENDELSSDEISVVKGTPTSNILTIEYICWHDIHYCHDLEKIDWLSTFSLYQSKYQITGNKTIISNDLCSYYDYITKMKKLFGINLNSLTHEEFESLEYVLSDLIEVSKRFRDCLFYLKDYIKKYGQNRKGSTK